MLLSTTQGKTGGSQFGGKINREKEKGGHDSGGVYFWLRSSHKGWGGKRGGEGPVPGAGKMVKGSIGSVRTF